jgi:hypothetical protein
MRINHFIDEFDTSHLRSQINNVLNGKIKMVPRNNPQMSQLDLIKDLNMLASTLDDEKDYLIKKSPELAHFDLGDLYKDLPDDEYEALVNYSISLIKEGMFSLPYDKICLSFNYGPKNMMIIESTNEKNGFDFKLYQNIGEKFKFPNNHPDGLIFTVLYSGDFMNISPPINLISKTAPKKHDEQNSLLANYCASALLAINAILSTDGIIIHANPAPVSLNKKRAKLGKSPIPEIKEIRIKVGNRNYSASGHDLAGKHASPRLHWRRGHIRKLSDGKITNVRPCLVGALNSPNYQEPQKPIYNVQMN